MNDTRTQIPLETYLAPSPTSSQYYLEEILKTTGYNLQSLSAMSGIPRTTLSRIHKGTSKNLRTENFMRLLQLYAKTTDQTVN